MKTININTADTLSLSIVLAVLFFQDSIQYHDQSIVESNVDSLIPEVKPCNSRFRHLTDSNMVGLYNNHNNPGIAQYMLKIEHTQSNQS